MPLAAAPEGTDKALDAAISALPTAIFVWLKAQVARPGTPATLKGDLDRLGKQNDVIGAICGPQK